MLAEADVVELQSSAAASANMRASLLRFRAFLGLTSGAPEPSRWEAWAHNGNHNLLRVTRAIRSLRLFGLEEEARAFYDDAMDVARAVRLSQVTQKFWAVAMQDPAMGPLQRR